ncbi:MAG: aspartyl protease family protein [Treponema sp.]|nr:aspartyl protease family protein [Treponema sp.]
MGIVHTDITLKNVKDMFMVEKGLIPEQEVRQITVKALVDSGAWTMVINEDTRAKLGLETTKTAPGKLADGNLAEYKLTDPVEIWWKDRSVICEALVIPTADENLLGAIPLEAMDLMINPRKQEVMGVHGDQILHSVKAV